MPIPERDAVESAPTDFCKCGLPDKWARDPSLPVEFDATLNEYHLVRGTKRRWFTVMHYCFWCGGRLPESTRGRLFTEPEKGELEEVQSVLADARSRADVFRIFGEPDASFDWSDDDEALNSQVWNVKKWDKSFRYSTRWNSLDVIVLEYPDGSVEYACAGKYVGLPNDVGPPVSCCRKPWWKFWK